jgi:hypothetical protein
MEKNIDYQKLMNKVLNKIKEDVAVGDVTAIEEILIFVPTNYLIGFLPEEDWPEFIPEGEDLYSDVEPEDKIWSAMQGGTDGG